jgi:hypothetical protein
LEFATLKIGGDLFISQEPADMANLDKPSVKEPCLNCDEVFETLGHLAARNGEVAGVEEVAHPHVIVKIRLRLKRRRMEM